MWEGINGLLNYCFRGAMLYGELELCCVAEILVDITLVGRGLCGF